MVVTRKTICLYPDLDNMAIYILPDEDNELKFETIQTIVENSCDRWYLEDPCIPLSDYVRQELDKYHIEYEISITSDDEEL